VVWAYLTRPPGLNSARSSFLRSGLKRMSCRSLGVARRLMKIRFRRPRCAAEQGIGGQFARWSMPPSLGSSSACIRGRRDIRSRRIPFLRRIVIDPHHRAPRAGIFCAGASDLDATGVVVFSENARISGRNRQGRIQRPHHCEGDEEEKSQIGSFRNARRRGWRE